VIPPENSPRILVAGIGNIFLGDDGFGCEVAARLSQRRLPAEARVVDFGIRSFDLTYALMDGYDLTILVDAVPRGGTPGTLYVIEPDLEEIDNPNPQAMLPQAMLVDTHTMNPVKVLSLARAMGGEFKRILLVGCEPATLGPEEGQMGLSSLVMASVDEAVELVESLIKKSLADLPQAGAHMNQSQFLKRSNNNELQ
jgi:hydrogenase maturation protease